MDLMTAACKRRVCRKQALNAESSRGHLVVMFEIVQDGRCSLLYFLDLAGSENVKKSGVEGEGFNEARDINVGLYNLRIVVGQLAARKAVPWSWKKQKNNEKNINKHQTIIKKHQNITKKT